MPCPFIDRYQNFALSCCLHRQGMNYYAQVNEGSGIGKGGKTEQDCKPDDGRELILQSEDKYLSISRRSISI